MAAVNRTEQWVTFAETDEKWSRIFGLTPVQQIAEKLKVMEKMSVTFAAARTMGPGDIVHTTNALVAACFATCFNSQFRSKNTVCF
jgi:hypothetical protein